MFVSTRFTELLDLNENIVVVWMLSVQDKSVLFYNRILFAFAKISLYLRNSHTNSPERNMLLLMYGNVVEI